MTKYKIIGALNLFFGIVQLFFLPVMLLIVLPNTDLGAELKNANILSTILLYLSLIFIFFLGIVNIFVSSRLFLAFTPNKDTFLKAGIALLVINMFSADLPTLSTKVMSTGDTLSKHSSYTEF